MSAPALESMLGSPFDRSPGRSLGREDEELLEGVALPRAQTGSQPQHLIVTLFGDYWLERPEHLPSAGLVALAQEFGVSPTSARAALSRLARRGLLTSSKSGRNTYYGLTRKAERVLRKAQARIMSFGRAPSRPWDGRWVVVVFSVPEDRRDVRHALRTRLRWLGFASLYDGVWVSPRPVAAESARVLHELGVEQATVLESSALHPSTGLAGHPLTAWDLDELRQVYQGFVDEFAPVHERVRSGQVGAAEALVTRTAIMDIWRSFPALDPDLPPSMLPEHWPRDEAREIFAHVYDALGPLAEFRFRQVLGDVSPELAELAHHVTTRSVTGG